MSETVAWILGALVPVGLWCAWWLFCVDWRKTWPVLARGGWLGVVLLLFVITLAWSGISPTSCNCLRVVTIPNFWWQLGYVSTLTALALFCGWLQAQFGWVPPEVAFDPPAHHDHGHGGHH
jgi:hypothetical protein